jgi:hypothetical protein
LDHFRDTVDNFWENAALVLPLALTSEANP